MYLADDEEFFFESGLPPEFPPAGISVALIILSVLLPPGRTISPLNVSSPFLSSCDDPGAWVELFDDELFPGTYAEEEADGLYVVSDPGAGVMAGAGFTSGGIVGTGL